MLELPLSDIKPCARTSSPVWCVGWGGHGGCPLHSSVGSGPGTAPAPRSWPPAPPPQRCPQDPAREAASPGSPSAARLQQPRWDCSWKLRTPDPVSGALPLLACSPCPGVGNHIQPPQPPPTPLLGSTPSWQHCPLGAPSKQCWDELAEYTAGRATISARSGPAPPAPPAGPPRSSVAALAASPALSRAAVASWLMQQMMHMARGSLWSWGLGRSPGAGAPWGCPPLPQTPTPPAPDRAQQGLDAGPAWDPQDPTAPGTPQQARGPTKLARGWGAGSQRMGPWERGK